MQKQQRNQRNRKKKHPKTMHNGKNEGLGDRFEQSIYFNLSNSIELQ